MSGACKMRVGNLLQQQLPAGQIQFELEVPDAEGSWLSSRNKTLSAQAPIAQFGKVLLDNKDSLEELIIEPGAEGVRLPFFIAEKFAKLHTIKIGASIPPATLATLLNLAAACDLKTLNIGNAEYNGAGKIAFDPAILITLPAMLPALENLTINIDMVTPQALAKLLQMSQSAKQLTIYGSVDSINLILRMEDDAAVKARILSKIADAHPGLIRQAYRESVYLRNFLLLEITSGPGLRAKNPSDNNVSSMPPLITSNVTSFLPPNLDQIKASLDDIKSRGNPPMRPGI